MNELGGRGGPQGTNPQIEFLEFLDTREQELPASFIPSKILFLAKVMASQRWARAYIYSTEYAREFQSRLLKTEK